MKKNEAIEGYLIIIGAVFTWSFSEIIVKILQNSVGPLTLSFFRFFIGSLFLLIILSIKKDFSGMRKMIKNNWRLLLLASCFALGMSNVIYFIGVTSTKANISATLYTTYPIWITIYSIFILNEKKNLKSKFLGCTIGIIGVSILMTNLNFTEFFSSENLVGNILVLIGSIMWGLYSVLGKKIQMNEKETTNCPLKFAIISLFLASIPIFLILVITPEFDTFMNYSFESWFWILFLSIISTGLGIFLLFEGIKRLDEVSKGMSLAFLKPIFATILAFLILNELPTMILIISIALIMVSIFLINKKTKFDTNIDYSQEL